MFSLKSQDEFETWLPFPGAAGFYEISNLGRVRSKYLSNRRKGEFNKPVKRNDGYLQVAIYVNGRSRNWPLHRAVLLAFVGDPVQGMQGAHLDGDKENNALSNLIWATSLENHGHKIQHGTSGKGETNSKAKLTEQQVKEIRAAYRRRSKTVGCTALAEKYGVTMQGIWGVVNFKCWKHI